MEYRKLSDADLVGFAKNVEDQLTAHAVDGLTGPEADALAAELTALNTPYGVAVDASIGKTAEKESATAAKRALRDEVIFKLSSVRNHLLAAESPKKAYDICGFNFPQPPSTIIANDPTELSGQGFSNGVNRLVWKGNNKPGNVVYEVWRRYSDSDTIPYVIIGTTRRQVFVDTPVVPGEYYRYKVRAVAATNTSNFSNIAVVYGML